MTGQEAAETLALQALVPLLLLEYPFTYLPFAGGAGAEGAGLVCGVSESRRGGARGTWW